MKKLTNKFIIIYDHPLRNGTDQYWGTPDYPHKQAGRAVWSHQAKLGYRWGTFAVFGDNTNIIPVKRASKYVKYIQLTKAQLVDMILSEYSIKKLIPNIIDNKTGVWKHRHEVKYKDMIRTLRKELNK